MSDEFVELSKKTREMRESLTANRRRKEREADERALARHREWLRQHEAAMESITAALDKSWIRWPI